MQNSIRNIMQNAQLADFNMNFSNDKRRICMKIDNIWLQTQGLCQCLSTHTVFSPICLHRPYEMHMIFYFLAIFHTCANVNSTVHFIMYSTMKSIFDEANEVGWCYCLLYLFDGARSIRFDFFFVSQIFTSLRCFCSPHE